MTLSYRSPRTKSGFAGAPGQVHQVEDHEEGDDDAGPPHRAGREVRRRRSRAAPGSGPGGPAGSSGSAGRAATMWSTNAAISPMRSAPEHARCAGRRARRASRSHSAYSLRCSAPEVQLEVPDHVGEHEAQQRDAAERHDPLLADRRAPELQRAGGPRRRARGIGAPVYRASRSGVVRARRSGPRSRPLRFAIPASLFAFRVPADRRSISVAKPSPRPQPDTIRSHSRTSS